MPVFVLSKSPEGHIRFEQSFSDRVPALAFIRQRLARKTLMCSANIYTIHNWEGCETISEDTGLE